MPTATTCTLRFPGFQLRPLYPEFIGSRILFVQEILWKSRVRGTRMFPSPVWSVARAPEKCSIPKESRCILPSSSIHRVHTSLSLCKFSRVSFYEERMDGICSTLLEYFLEYILDECTWTLCPVSESSGSVSLFIRRVFSFLFPGISRIISMKYFKYVISKNSKRIYTRWMYLDSLSRFRIKRFRFIVYKTSFLFSFSRKTNISNYFKYVISKDSKRIYTRWIYLLVPFQNQAVHCL